MYRMFKMVYHLQVI